MTDRRLTRAALALLLTAAALGMACDEPPSAEVIRAHIERAVPGARFEKEANIRLGRFSFALAKGVMRLVEPGDGEMGRAMSHIKKVHVAVYEVVALPEDAERLELPKGFEKNLAKEGWYPMVKTVEEDSQVVVFLREDADGTIRNLYLVELDAAELVVIDMAGRLDRMVAEFVAEDPDGFLSELGG